MTTRAALLSLTCTLLTTLTGCEGQVGDLAEEGGLATTEAALTVSATSDATLKAPRCASLASTCTSGTLLTGRAANELNTPNTVNRTCVDGTIGTFHSDESLDALSITTLDGTNLAPGKHQVVALVGAHAHRRAAHQVHLLGGVPPGLHADLPHGLHDGAGVTGGDRLGDLLGRRHFHGGAGT